MANYIQNYNGGVQFKTGASQGLTVDINGNIGVGTTPSAWAGCYPIQLGNSGGIYGFINSNTLGISANSTWNGTNDIYRYSGNAASKYSQSGGVHQWSAAPSGTAGSVITWNTAMTLDASGNLGLGTSTHNDKLSISTSNSSALVLSNSSISLTNTQGASSEKGSIFKFFNDYRGNNYTAAIGGGLTSSTATGSTGYLAFFTKGLDSDSVPAERMRINSNGNLLLTSGTGALGYGTGAGGTVTQLTSKSTAVTLNKPTGQITMNNATLASGASVSFSLNNSLIYDSDIVIITPTYSIVNIAKYTFEVLFTNIGGAYIRITNISAVSLSEAVQFKFVIIKGAMS